MILFSIIFQARAFELSFFKWQKIDVNDDGGDNGRVDNEREHAGQHSWGMGFHDCLLACSFSLSPHTHYLLFPKKMAAPFCKISSF